MSDQQAIVKLIHDRLLPIQNSISLIDMQHVDEKFSDNMLQLEDAIFKLQNMLEQNLTLKTLLTDENAVKNGVSLTLDQGKSNCFMTSLAYQMIVRDLEQQQKIMQSDEFRQLNNQEQNVSALMHEQREIGMLMVLQNELNTINLSLLADAIRLGQLNQQQLGQAFESFDRLRKPIMQYVERMQQ